MWYPSTVTEPPTTEPVTLAQAQTQCGVMSDEVFFTDQITGLIAAARAHVESYTGARFAAQTIVSQCDGFCDMERLPEGPLSSVTSIKYIDLDGAEQTLANTVYEAHKDGLEPSIALKYGQTWPAIRRGSRITLTADYGGTVPKDVSIAMLLFIADKFHNRENAKVGDWTALDCLLCNHRRGV
jgi:uncharacterized phiE125 gp8 family phage protein